MKKLKKAKGIKATKAVKATKKDREVVEAEVTVEVKEKKKGRPRKEAPTPKGGTEKVANKKTKKEKAEPEEVVKEIKFKKAKKEFRISTKNADWNEIKSLTEELLKTLKSFIWDVAADDADIEKLSEFMLVQILYHCIDADILDKFPGMYKMVCTLADRYPVAFDIE